MGEKSDQLERHIREERNELSQHISELHQKVKSAVDWRVQFNERPLVMIGLAFGGGILLSALLGRPHSKYRKRDSNERSRNSPYRESTHRGQSVEVDAGAVNGGHKSSDTLDRVKGALFAVAATKVGSYLEQIVPGFNKHYQKSEARES